MNHDATQAHRAPTQTPDLAPWVALVATGMALGLLPFAHTPSRTYLLAFALVSIASLLCARFDQRDRWRRIIYWPVLLFLGAFGCSILASDLRPLLIHRFWAMPVLALLMPVVQIACWRSVTRRGVLILILCTVLITTLDLLLQRLTGRSMSGEVLTGPGNIVQSGSLGNPNDLASLMVLLPLALAALPRRNRVLSLVAAILIIASTNIAAVLITSRQVLIGWCVASLAGLLNFGERSTWKPNPLVLMLMVVVVAVSCLQFMGVPLLSTEGFSTEFVMTVESGMGTERSLQYRYAWWLFTESPWLGIGSGGFGEYWALGIANGWTWNGTPLPSVAMPWVHNLELEVLCETGLVGAAAFLICIGHALRGCTRGLRRGPEARTLALAVLGSGLVFLVIGLVDMSFIKDWVRVVFWLGLGLAAAAGTSENDLPEKA